MWHSRKVHRRRHQPYARSAYLLGARGPNGRWTIVFNGEIYNCIELREGLQAKGHNFATKTGTEVLLTAWAEWGENCLHRFDGMFALFVHGVKDGSLTCVRDPFEIKPFYYSQDHCKGFAFASETPALLELLDQTPRLNRNRAYRFLRWGEVNDCDGTFYTGVLQLEPGHMSRLSLFNPAKIAVKLWWHPSIEEDNSLSFDQVADKLRDLFLQNVKRQLRSDVPLPAALSAGVDSSEIVSEIRHLEPDMPIHTFSYVARGTQVDEEKWCCIGESHAGTVAHYTDYPVSELCSDLDTSVAAQEEPIAGMSYAAQCCVFQLAKSKAITVMLDRQGADELLAGYFGYPTLAFSR